ncbi:contractile injection system protein, VgrG/Pvc8 family [Chitinimonas koreensis]|uniref:contractile injection system protein, VgrG/Pvc8 family n=1 Tax=Chitinimonas koreensis TaxID=356302 RepID=UPI00040A8D8E|nr:contractile injection system protein, VgrG/Pvc8 family [Chitinimonas koreensis]
MNAPFQAIGVGRVETVERPEPALFLHLAIFIDSRTVIGDETLRLVSFTGSESVSEPFEYQLELHANDQWKRDPQSRARIETLRFDELIGKPVTFAVDLPARLADPETELAQSNRDFQDAIAGKPAPSLSLFNGIVASLAMGAPGVYHLTVKPALHRLTLANRYQIYDDRTVVQALTDVLAYHHIVPDMAAADSLAISRQQDWLQAGESDYDFVRRLMGKAHLYFYFRQNARGHQLVFANRADYPDQVMGGRPLRYVFTDTQENGLAQFDVISDYRYRQNLNIGAVRAVFTRQYEAWQVEGVPPILQFDAAPVDLPPVGGADSERVFHQHKVYQYGSDKLEAERFARMTGQASRSAASQLSGESFCALFRAGYRFAMSEDQMAGSSPMPVRPTLNGKEFVLTKVEHEASLDGGYKNKFEASETDGLLSAFSLADTQQGSVLATVVDYPDHHTPRSWRFYEKSDFAPQTQDYLDHDSGQSQVTAQGVYVRLATDPDGTRRWVKLAAHMQTAPEIGAQVIVSRANDESELPELQQIVQAGGTRAVTPLESNSPLSWTASTHVGNSYGARYSDGVNVSFGAKSDANLNRAVLIATNAYNTAKFRDTGYSQGANYGFSTAESAAAGASQDLAATYGPYGPADDILGVNESFGSSFSRSIGKVQSSVANHRISYSDSRFGKSESVLYVEQTTTSTSTHVGTVSNTTTMKADNLSTQTVEGVTTSTSTHTGTVTNTTTMKADNISTQTIGGATTSTSTHTGAVTNTTTMDSTSTTTTTHNGTVNNTTTVNATSNNTTTHNGSVNNFTTITGTSVSKNVIAVQSNSSAIGVNNSNDAVGLAANFSATGLSSAMSATGVSSHISLTGVDFKMNLFGVSEDISLGIVGYRFANKAANPEINMEGPVIQLLAALKIVI